MPIWLIIIFSLLITLIIMAIIPLRYELQISASKSFTLSLLVHWGKLPLLSLLPFDGKREEELAQRMNKKLSASQKRKLAKKRRSLSEPRSHPLQVVRLLINPILWDQIFELFRSLHHVLQVQKYKLSGRIGFESPMQTSRLTTIIALLDHPNWDYQGLEPVWTEDTIDLTLTMYGRLTIIALARRWFLFRQNRELRALYTHIKAML